MPKPLIEKKTRRPYQPAQEYTCALPECGKVFTTAPSNKVHGHAFCCQSHAALFNNRAQGRQPAIEAPCGCGCGQIVKRYVSQMAKNSDGTLYVSREHFNAARRAFQDLRRGKKHD